jgi:hypothetical protein
MAATQVNLNLSPEAILWMLGAAIGISLNIFMIHRTTYKRRIATDQHEKRIVFADTVQWGFGLFVKCIGLWLGVWAMFLLPPPGTSPDTAVETWAATNARSIFGISLLLMMFGMDVRDGMLITIDEVGRRVFRREIRESHEKKGSQL